MRSIGLGLAVAAFGVPALVFVAGFHLLMPALSAAGMRYYYAYCIGIGVPLALLLVAALVTVAVRRGNLSWGVIRDELRLRPMDRQQWLFTVLAILIGALIGTSVLGIVNRWLVLAGIVPVPRWLPSFLSNYEGDLVAGIHDATGGMRGNWLVVAATVLLLFVNVMGEELWWRGVILPGQESTGGRHAWVSHGVLWAFFHAFKWWDLFPLFPVMLALSYVTSRFRNTTPGIVIHVATNGLILVPLVLMVTGAL